MFLTLVLRALNIVFEFLYFGYNLQNQASTFHWQTFQNLQTFDLLRDVVQFVQCKNRVGRRILLVIFCTFLKIFY